MVCHVVHLDVPAPANVVPAPQSQLVVGLSPDGTCLTTSLTVILRPDGPSKNRYVSFIRLPHEPAISTLQPIVVVEAPNFRDAGDPGNMKQLASDQLVWNAAGTLAAVSCRDERRICVIDIGCGLQIVIPCSRYEWASPISGNVLQIEPASWLWSCEGDRISPPCSFCRLLRCSKIALGCHGCAWSTCGKKRLQWMDMVYSQSSSLGMTIVVKKFSG